MHRLEGRVAIITGGGGAIGRATARRLAREGASVVVADLNAGAAESVAAELRENGSSAVAVQVDVTDEASVQALIARAVEAFGRIDVLHNNAGILLPGSVTDATLADWNRTLAVNATGAFLCSKYALPVMLANGGGSIIHTSSTSGLVGEPAIAAYCASKGAVLMLAKQMSIDYARKGVRVNAICPGWIDTAFNDPVIALAGGKAALGPFVDMFIPMGRQGVPEEIADAVAFLASDDSRLMTGAALVVDAGLTAQ